MDGSRLATSSLSRTLSHSTGPTSMFLTSSSQCYTPPLVSLLGRYFADHGYCRTKLPLIRSSNSLKPFKNEFILVLPTWQGAIVPGPVVDIEMQASAIPVTPLGHRRRGLQRHDRTLDQPDLSVILDALPF